MSNTAHRAYPKPVPSNNVSDDVLVLQQAMDLVDGDIHLLFAAIAGLAPVSHEHVIADVQGLSAALDGKAAVGHAHSLEDLSDVAGSTSAPVGYVMVKQADGNWGPASAASIVGAHEHVIGDIVNLQTALDSKTLVTQMTGLSQATLVDNADHFIFRRASDGLAYKVLWSQFKTWLWTAWGALIQAGTAKSTPIDADMMGIADSAATNATKKTTFLEAWTNYFKVKADALYQPLKTILTTLGNLANASGYLLNNGSGGLSWGALDVPTQVKETVFLSSGNYTPNANGKFYEFIVVGDGGNGESGGNGNTGAAGIAAAVVHASGPKSAVGNAALVITIGAANTGSTAAGTPTTVGGLVSAGSPGRGGNTGTTGNSNLPQFTAFGANAVGNSGDRDHNHHSLSNRFAFGGAGGASGNTNQSAGSGQPGGPGVVVVREYL